MWIVHLDGCYWRLASSPFESRFGTIAQLNMVCWLEITAAFRVPVPGEYDVWWRMDMPSESAADFHCTWSASLYDENHRLLSALVEYEHAEKPAWSTEVIGKGWFHICIGRIQVPSHSTPTSIEIKLLGGNSTWFRDLKIDFAELRPVDANSPPLPHIPFIQLDSPPMDTPQVNID